MRISEHTLFALTMLVPLLCAIQVEAAPAVMDPAAMDTAAMDTAVMDPAAMDTAAMDTAAMDTAAMDLAGSWASGLIHRAKRSLLWRWNTLKPVGAGCRDNYECATYYCRKHLCTFKPGGILS